MAVNKICIFFLVTIGYKFELALGQKTGRCPDQLPLPKSFTCPKEVDCHADNNCDGDLKCCDDSCGNSRCLKPIPDVQVIKSGEICPSIFAPGSVPNGCRKIKTTFCFKYDCTRCCVHDNTCNPHSAILKTMAQCHRELCLKHTCAQQGSKCEVDRRSNSPVCVCKQSCPSKVLPVCGDDYRTYDNNCFLYKKACENNRKIKILHFGICAPSTATPGKKLIDGQPEIIASNEVIVAGDMVNLTCKTIVKAATLKWFKKRGDRQVAVVQSMLNSSSENSLMLTIKKTVFAHSGAYICQSVVNGKKYSAEVTMDVNVKEMPSMTCQEPKDEGSCSGAFDNYHYDVKDDSCKQFRYGGCGGNNNNFETLQDCKKKCEGTRTGCPKSLALIKTSCPSTVNNECSSDKECPKRFSCCFNGCSKMCFNASFLINTSSYTTTTSPTKGSGVTVPLSRKQLPTEQPTKRLEKYCGRQICKFYAECKVNNEGTRECTCPNDCDFTNMRPVCGTDMETGIQRSYLSECIVKITSCRLQTEIVISDGYCDSTRNQKEYQPTDLCKLRRCPRHGYCSINPFTGLPKCLCPRYCNFYPKTLCATDGRTYLNECIMRVKSCKKDFYITKKHDGPCRH